MADEPPAEQRVLTLYTRQDCTLCLAAEEALAQLASALHFRVDARDVDADPALTARFDDRVPVIAAGDDILAEGRIELGSLAEAIVALGRPGDRT